MGGFSSKATSQVLICGPEKSGKTTLLYRKKLRDSFTSNETIGFQYEELPVGNEASGAKVGFWDVGGGEAC